MITIDHESFVIVSSLRVYSSDVWRTALSFEVIGLLTADSEIHVRRAWNCEKYWKITKEERADIIANRLLPPDFEVCITSYEICLIEKSALKKFSIEYIAIDEAHRIKNVDSILSQIVRSFTSRGRMLITGTPLQNNLKELFALLN